MSAPLDNIELELGKTSTFYKLKDNESKFFMIRLDTEEFHGTEDLVIKVQASELFGDPDLYISKKNTKPNSKENSDMICATYGKDICSLSHNSLTAGQWIYVGVKCFQECKFSLKASLTEQIELDDSQEQQLDFQAEETKIFKFYVPAKSAAQDDQNRVNSVTITAMPLLSQQDNIIMTASTKEDIVPGTGSKRGVPGWRKGKVLRLSEQLPEDWCTDCWVTILVDVTDVGKYSIMAKSNVGVQQLQQDKKIDDVAFNGDKACYKYYVQSNENDMVLKVQQYSGLVSFTVNPKKPAESFDSAAFKHVGTSNSNLVISAKERKNAQQQKGLYYICAVPHMTSTYSILVTEPAKNQLFSYLEDSYEENGEIQGQNMTVYVYKVPPLEYQGEDIQLKFRVTTLSGEKPILAATFCQDQKDHRKCAINVTKEAVLGQRSSYTKANIMGKDLSLVIDHDERTCQDVYNGECYYVVALIGQAKPEEFSTYSIRVGHSQLNYQVLQEGNMLTDFVDLGNYRYYSFTLMPDPKVKRVSFRLNTLHGDADIYVSRMHLFPNKIDYEKSSVKTSGQIDEVFFDDKKLATTYYIGVYSFQYSTYNLVVKVEREGQQSDESIPLLSEGIPFTGSIHNEKNYDRYRVQVKQLKGYEKTIKIQSQLLKGKVEFYVNYNAPATSSKYLWSSKNNLIEIATTDKNFHGEGTYYVAVYPSYSFWNKFTDDTYKYTITYTTKDSYMYLQSGIPVEQTQTTDSYQFYRHFVTKKTEDMTLSLTVYNGNPQMYVSVNPDTKYPSAQEHEFNTWNQQLVSGQKGKAIQLSSSQIKKSNPVCSSSIGTNADVEPCAVFIGVYCDKDCKYSMKLSYSQDAPQSLIVGVPQHDMVRKGDFNYYYIIVREGKTKQIYGVLNSLSGNADLYVRFQENPQLKAPENWLTPSKSEYTLKSTELLKQDMVIISPDNLADCFGRFKSDDPKDERQCAIMFGIYAPETSSSGDDYTRYNLVVYSDVTYIQNGAAISGKVDQSEFQYYIFDALCADCPIVISLSTFSSGDPDLFVKFGDSQLPTTTSFDLQSSTFKSELMRIDLQSDEVKAKGIKTLKGSIIIGVYGNKKSDYQISVTQEKNPITPLVSGYSMKISQQPFETTYFMYYHMLDEKDFKLALNVKSGKVDVLISTFKELDDNQNFVDRLPKSKRNSQWILENVQSTSQYQTKELLVTNTEVNYCSHCYYLIGVSSQDKRSEFTVLVHSLDANFQNSLLLKVSEPNTYSLKPLEIKVFKFIIDEYQDFQVQVTMKSGYAYSYLNFVESKDEPLESFFGSSTITIKKDDAKFHTGKMYYLIIEGNTDCEFTILIDQQKQFLVLSDGVPTTAQVISSEDISKPFIYYLPDGDQTVNIQVKSKNDRFFPALYIKYYDELESQLPTIIFPPGGDDGFIGVHNWDKQYKVLNFQKQFKNIKGGKAGLALNLYVGHLNTVNLDERPSAIITVTTSSIVQMVGGTTYVGTLKQADQYIIYQSEDFIRHKQGYALIEFSGCRGNAKLDIIDDPQTKRSAMGNLQPSSTEFGRSYYFVPLPRNNLYIMVKPESTLNQNEGQTTNVTDFLIKVRYNTVKNLKNIDYHFQKGKQLSWEPYSLWSNSVNLTWSKLQWSDTSGAIRSGITEYNVIVTKSDRARLDSMCSLREDISSQFMYKRVKTNDTSIVLQKMQPGTKYYINVFGKFNTGVHEEEEIVPYEPMVLYIEPESDSFLSISNVIILLTLLFVGYAMYYVLRKICSQEKPFYKEKGPSKHIEYELTSVRGGRSSTTSSTVGEYQRPIDLIKDLGEEESLHNTSMGVGDTSHYGGF